MGYFSRNCRKTHEFPHPPEMGFFTYTNQCIIFLIYSVAGGGEKDDTCVKTSPPGWVFCLFVCLLFWLLLVGWFGIVHFLCSCCFTSIHILLRRLPKQPLQFHSDARQVEYMVDCIEIQHEVQ